MVWDKPRILQEIRRLHRGGENLSYTALARRRQPLVSAAAYHFGSYRVAVEQAGIDYAEVTRRPRWTRQNIIALLKKAKRKNQDLHWAAVTRRGDELSRAAFAALQPRLFGSWDRALHAAGLDADEISLYRTWDRNTVVFELKSRAQDDEPLNSGALQQDDPGLHAAALRYFGSYDSALRAANLNPEKLRQRRHWTRQSVISAVRALKRRSGAAAITDARVRRQDAPLYGAMIRLFGSFRAAAAAAAGVNSQTTRRRMRGDKGRG
jgi:hypothetical protein